MSKMMALSAVIYTISIPAECQLNCYGLSMNSMELPGYSPTVVQAIWFPILERLIFSWDVRLLKNLVSPI